MNFTHRLGRGFALLAIWGLCGSAFAAPFTAGNLAVYRTGDGGSSVTNAATAVFIDEYTPSGTLVQSIPMPTTASGANHPLVAQGNATLEGLINRSTNGQYLLVTGYDVPLGTATPAQTLASNVPRVIGRIDANGAVDTSTSISDLDGGADTSPTQSGSPRSAISTDGASIYVVGDEGGVRQTALGSTGASTLVSDDVMDLRHVDLFGGGLYVSTGESGPNGIQFVDVGSGTMTGLGGIPGGTTSANTVQFFLADLSAEVEGVDSAYVSDSRSQANGGGLRKYSLVGTDWVETGSITGVQTPPVSNLRGLTGTVDGSTVTLYGVRASSGGGQLLKFEDTSGYNGVLSGAATLLAEAQTNTQMKGIDFVPAASAGTPGDFNNDNVVDGDDLTEWRNNFGGAGADADSDGDSDGADFLIWQRNLGTGSAAASALAIPEPCSLLLLSSAIGSIALGRRSVSIK